jgi:hypothetical protein
MQERNERLRNAVIEDRARATVTVLRRLVSDDYRYMAGIVWGDAVGIPGWWLYVEVPGDTSATRLGSQHDLEGRPWLQLEQQLRDMVALDPYTDMLDGLRPSDHRYCLVKGIELPGVRKDPLLFDPQRLCRHASGLYAGWGFLKPAAERQWPWLLIGFQQRALNMTVPPSATRIRPDIESVIDAIDSAGKELSHLDLSDLPMWPKQYRAAIRGEASYTEVMDRRMGQDSVLAWGTYPEVEEMAWIFAETRGGSVAMPLPSSGLAGSLFDAFCMFSS